MRRHPQLWDVAHDWNVFAIYHAFYLLNWIGWEYLWRGFVLFGTAPTFGRWAGARLSAENRRQLWIPEGFAHGFMALSEAAEVLYKTTGFYAREHERCIRWDDPTLAIEWPLGGRAPVVSEKDARGQPFGAAADR